MASREDIIERLEQDLEDYFYVPFQGFVPHWPKKYWLLHKAVAEYFGMETYIPKNIDEM